MTSLFNQYQLLWLRLKDKVITADDAANVLGIEKNKVRVVLSRMKKDHMLVIPVRGKYRIVEPTKWIRIKEIALRNLPIPEQLIEDLAIHSKEIKAIILHGSVVSGNMTPLSDVDVLIISDENLKGLEDKYTFPLSIEVQPTRGYDKIYVQHAVKEGEVLYDDGILTKIMNSKKTRGDYIKKLGEIQSTLFKLEDEKLFESLTLMDISHILCSSLRGLELLEGELCAKTTRIRINQKILKEVKYLYDLSKAGKRGVPDVTRNDLRKLRSAIINKWVRLKMEVDKWAEKRR